MAVYLKARLLCIEVFVATNHVSNKHLASDFILKAFASKESNKKLTWLSNVIEIFFLKPVKQHLTISAK